MEAREKRLAEVRAMQGPTAIDMLDDVKALEKKVLALSDYKSELEQAKSFLLEELERLSGSLSGQWVSCSERLPEPKVKVLVWNGYAVFVAMWKGEHWGERVQTEVRILEKTRKITHWMPLPEPPLANKEAIDKARGVE